MQSSPPPQRSLDLKLSGEAPELRRDYLHDYYVLIAPKRRDRPIDLTGKENVLIETDSSPRLDLQTAVDELLDADGNWLTRVVENKYPALTLDNPQAYGQQELVIDTPLRNTSFGELPVDQVHTILLTYQKRSRTLYKLPYVKYVSVFKNDGKAAGASLAHAHSQIIALPIVPPRLHIEGQTAENYQKDKGRDPYDDIIKLELQSGSRVIHDSAFWLCFAPYAPQWHLEVWWLPKRPIQRLVQANEEELQDLAGSVSFVTRQLTALEASYNLSLEDGVNQSHRLHVKVRGRDVVSPHGGLEVSTGIIINPVAPEAAADWYRRGT